MESQNSTAFAIPAVVGQQNGYGQIEVLFLDASNLVLQQAAPDETLTSSPLELQILSTADTVGEREKSVHVCSFCQKFSQKENIIVAHIETDHSESLLMGTPAKKFVTRLQSLQCEEEKKQAPKKRGRPKKCDQQRTEAVKTTPEPEPVPSSDGYFWCQKCYKYFNKARQLMRHICLKNDDHERFQNDDVFDMDFEEEENLDMDNSKDFKMHMKIDSDHQSITKNCYKQSISINQVPATYHLKEDKCDVPIFSNEDEKANFEKHLKNVDFRCVDHLYAKEGSKRQGRRKKSCKHDQTYLYSCEICKKVFKSLSHIRMHCLTHTTLKPFTCLKCPYSTNTKGNLYIHMRKHTGNVFRCGYCEFKSGNRSHLIEHEETHLSNSWSCKLCKNTYKTLKSLMNHVRMYHTNNPGKKYLSLLTWKSKQRNIMTYDNSYKNPNLVCSSEDSITNEIGDQLQFLESVVVNEQTFEPPSLNHSQSDKNGEPPLLNLNRSTNNVEPTVLGHSQSDKNGEPPLLNLNQSTNTVEPPVLSHTEINENFQSQFLNHSHLNQIPSKLTFNKFPQNSKPVIFKNINNDVEQNDQMLLLNGSCNDASEAYIEPPVLCNVYQQPQSAASYLENYPQATLPETAQFQFSEPKYQSSLPNNEQLEFSKSNYQESMNSKHSSIQFSDDFNSSVLKNCLQDSNFVDTADLIDNTLMGQCAQQLCKVNPVFTANSPLMEKGEISGMTQALLPVETPANDSQLHIQLDSEKYQEETESAETKLFEKCRRLQAYVCCVCTTIFIDPAKLKEHLKEHASGDGNYNNVTKQPEEQHVQDKRPEEVASSIDSVCKELTDTLTEEQMFDKHLEELYTSSLDMSWYLPELSVNVECLIDSVLEDSLNFPLSGKYDANDELSSKVSEDNILQYFDDVSFP